MRALLGTTLSLCLVACSRPSSRRAARRPDAPAAISSHGVEALPAPPSSAVVDLAPTLAPIRERFGLPALAAAVFDADHALAEGAVGLRAVDQPDAPVTVRDRWHLGSDTKAMTATLLARLVERGVLRWDTPLAEALRDEAATMRDEYRAVTLEQLLQHRGGVVSDLLAHPDLWAPLWNRRAPAHALRRAFVGPALALAPEVPVGTYRYANAGYILVGAAIERATGRAWEDLLREEVFAPLGMSSCGFGAPATVGTTDAPWGHRTIEGHHVAVAPGPRADNPSPFGPAGTVHCSLHDWARFAQMHLRGALGRPTPYLRPESFARMHAPPVGGDYALGWAVASRGWAGDRAALCHQGSNTMFRCSVWIAPSRERVLLVATNAADPRSSEAIEATLLAMIDAWVRRE